MEPKKTILILFSLYFCLSALPGATWNVLHCTVLFNWDIWLEMLLLVWKLKNMRLSTGDKKQKNEKELLTSLTNQQIWSWWPNRNQPKEFSCQVNHTEIDIYKLGACLTSRIELSTKLWGIAQKQIYTVGSLDLFLHGLQLEEGSNLQCAPGPP
jgi:hypothetical protein